MIKSILAATAALVAGSAAIATPSGTFTRGDAFAIRSCSVDGLWGSHVCYNEKREATISFFGLLNWPLINHSTGDKVVTLDCNRQYALGSRKADIAAEFCPLAETGRLPAASFLN